MFQASPQPNLSPKRLEPAFTIHFWVLVALTGLGAGIGGGLLMLLLHAVQHLAWSYTGGNFLAAVRHATTPRRIEVLAAAGLLVAMARWLLKLGGAGHGGEVAAAIWFHAGRMPPIATIARAILSIVIVGMGASVGREAAPKQFGALVADMLSDLTRLPDGQRRLLVACGAGAGIAAVYNVPFGGALFALEVLLGTLSLPLVAPALVASFIATAVSWLMLPNAPTYTVPVYNVTLGQLVWALLLGPVAGVASAAYVKLISRADAMKPKGVLRAVAPVVVLTLLGVTAIWFPELLGNGKGTTQEAFVGRIGLPLVLILLVLKPIATTACLGSGASGGLFTPTLTLGALLGGTLGEMWEKIWPGVATGSYALIGAGAVLAAAMQAPVSAIVLLLELTRRLDSTILPVLIAVSGAIVVGRLFESRSIYSGRIHAGRAAVRKPAKEAVSSATRHTELLHLLLKRGESEKPLVVLDENGDLIGEVSQHKAVSPTRAAGPLEIATAADFVSRASSVREE